MEEGCLVHLSTRMCPAHRLSALDGMKAALWLKKRVLCVSTQLIEAGVDIDFATVVRDLAGLDSIAQAAGTMQSQWRPSKREGTHCQDGGAAAEAVGRDSLRPAKRPSCAGRLER